MTAELLSVAVGAVVSVALEVVPGLKARWSTWQWKPLTLLGLFLALPLAAWALACFAGIMLIPLPALCGVEGGLRAAGLGFLTFLASQTTFAVATRRTENAVARQ